jgi:colanic acid/amylovoran biosynthesis glycosyltransferase
MKLVYVVNRFPALSETFIAREVLGLLDLGSDLEIFSLQSVSASDRAQFDSATQSLFEKTRFLNSLAVLTAFVRNREQVRKLAQKSGLLLTKLSENANRVCLLGRALAIAEFVQQNQIQQIHAHWPYSSKVAALVHQLTGIPYSVSIHAHEVVHENQHFPYIFDSLSFAAFCNKAAMQKLLEQLPDDYASKAYLVYHGVNLELPPPTADGKLRILSAGRLTPTKGFDRLIRSCAKALAAGINLELTILGRSSSGLDRELKDLAVELGLGDRLHLPGWVPHDRVSQSLQQSHVFALLANTNFHDGLPNVVLEAMASGRPVILSPLPAAPEAVTNGVEGFILEESDDREGFVRVLSILAAEPDRLKEMGQAARSRVEQNFDEKFHLQKLSSLFNPD